MIVKRFPADTRMDIKTFLNDKKIDDMLYSVFQRISMPVKDANGLIETVVYKEKIPSQSELANKIGVKSTKTVRSHLKYLVDNGFLIERTDSYVITNKEEIYLMIPLETLEFLLDVVKEPVIKTYIYLCQRFKYASSHGYDYTFTLQELADHLGMHTNGNGDTYKTLNHYLEALSDFGLIRYVSYFDGRMPKKKLMEVNFEYESSGGSN